jgi:hypothetical protein
MDVNCFVTLGPGDTFGLFNWLSPCSTVVEHSTVTPTIEGSHDNTRQTYPYNEVLLT